MCVCFRPVRSSVLPAGTASLLRVMVGQLALVAIAEAASVKVQLLARLSRSAAAEVGRQSERASKPAVATARRVDLKLCLMVAR